MLSFQETRRASLAEGPGIPLLSKDGSGDDLAFHSCLLFLLDLIANPYLIPHSRPFTFPVSAFFFFFHLRRLYF